VTRASNLATEKAVERFLDLNGEGKIPFGDLRRVYEEENEKWPLLCRKIRERKAKKSG
jgi:Ca2+-binding EF-hand superfamily protein